MAGYSPGVTFLIQFPFLLFLETVLLAVGFEVIPFTFCMFCYSHVGEKKNQIKIENNVKR
jgi:hypothetical protein